MAHNSSLKQHGAQPEVMPFLGLESPCLWPSYLPPLTYPLGHREKATDHKSPEEIYLMTKPLS
ncbi:Spermadhesin Z13 [Clarias magur]|uniref:Spermadhesin Z13 n=1 Tax=Clarias magur TaxID=1594786 RepID=A0A8J4U9A1_CLAMG|nr:Spermadhesin Z13 [Clarias magur]